MSTASEGLFTHVDNLELGVVHYGGTRHIVDRDGLVTRFFCGERGFRVSRRVPWRKPSCGRCIAEARRVEIRGV